MIDHISQPGSLARDRAGPEPSPAIWRQSFISGDDQGIDEHLPLVQFTDFFGRPTNFLKPVVREPRPLDRDTSILNAEVRNPIHATGSLHFLRELPQDADERVDGLGLPASSRQPIVDRFDVGPQRGPSRRVRRRPRCTGPASTEEGPAAGQRQPSRPNDGHGRGSSHHLGSQWHGAATTARHLAQLRPSARSLHLPRQDRGENSTLALRLREGRRGVRAPARRHRPSRSIRAGPVRRQGLCCPSRSAPVIQLRVGVADAATSHPRRYVPAVFA
ncbi:hypothetical protein SFUMM280S_06517 [Streptomyces fumanus]